MDIVVRHLLDHTKLTKFNKSTRRSLRCLSHAVWLRSIKRPRQRRQRKRKRSGQWSACRYLESWPLGAAAPVVKLFLSTGIRSSTKMA